MIPLSCFAGSVVYRSMTASETIEVQPGDGADRTGIFVSHATADDAVVRALQRSLGELGQDVWIDSRQLRGGDPLWPEIQRAIEEASGYVGCTREVASRRHVAHESGRAQSCIQAPGASPQRV
ncbi:MAG: TIR domain-containing protein [Deltaproteobacteria bacterium]|nr:MAG: TIR domain-containing protein [Deltaproteobacteria bacterium]TMQ18682.1 MAG: TIR domain-containing protein [Deltaproteobacteria bacterium]